MNKLLSAILISSLSLSLHSCDKEETSSGPSPFYAANGLYIACEGTFQASNSDVSYYNPDNSTTIYNAFKSVNNGSPGDVAQSLSIINNKLYVVVNNSGKIMVCDPHSLKTSGTITGLSSPRHMLAVSTQKAYVTDFSSNSISIINLDNGSVTGSIHLNGWTEEIVMLNNKVYVANPSTEYLYEIDPATDLLMDSIMTAKGGSHLQVDKNGKLWELCFADYMGAFPGTLHRIDVSAKTVEQSFTFSTNDNPNRLAMNSMHDSLYFINSNIYKMGITENALPSIAYIQSNNNRFYSIGVDPIRNELYVGDAIDYIQKGKITRYNSTGTKLNEFLSGIVPTYFLFF